MGLDTFIIVIFHIDWQQREGVWGVSDRGDGCDNPLAWMPPDSGVSMRGFEDRVKERRTVPSGQAAEFIPRDPRQNTVNAACKWWS